ncbi:hypothetical protein ACIQGZ_27495 [Streptomyces sp. NPDC092296]|uniref:hypothetical protein n=1 Tax=Streptomyces sp. NPDC092296 TaxID=3366012 RepID=UPI00380EAD1C
MTDEEIKALAAEIRERIAKKAKKTMWCEMYPRYSFQYSTMADGYVIWDKVLGGFASLPKDPRDSRGEGEMELLVFSDADHAIHWLELVCAQGGDVFARQRPRGSKLNPAPDLTNVYDLERML